MPKVKSSNVDEVEWMKGDLYVKFLSGETYKYLTVPKMLYIEMIDAKSVGKFLNEKIKERYVYQKIAAMPENPEIAERMRVVQQFEDIAVQLEKRGLVRREMDENQNTRWIAVGVVCPKCGGDCGAILQFLKEQLEK